MNASVHFSSLLAVIALGLMAGALVAEGAILVPFWRSLTPEGFLNWYKQHAALLQNFFGPLEITASMLALIAAALSWFNESAGRHLLAASAALSMAVLAVFPLYFRRANTSFRTGGIALECVGKELHRWSIWHWFRTIIAVAGFVTVTAALAA